MHLVCLRFSHRATFSKHRIKKRINLFRIRFSYCFFHTEDAGGNIGNAFVWMHEIPAVVAFVKTLPVRMAFESLRRGVDKYIHAPAG
jgi:hypothetical protein